MVNMNGGRVRAVDGNRVRYGPELPRLSMPRINWKQLVAQAKYWGWQLMTKGLLGLVYLTLVREGFVTVIPPLGLKLSKIPGLAALDNFEATYRLDLAFVLAFFVMLAVFWLWSRVLALYMHGDDTAFQTDDPGFRRRREIIFYSLATAILVGDGVLFYIALTQSSWGGSYWSFTALLGTMLYVAVLIFVTIVAIDLKENVLNAKLNFKINSKEETRDQQISETLAANCPCGWNDRV